jgi:phosphate/sulfate permease
MIIGAAGISFGLFLFGPKLINVVGNQITKLNQMRAYCVALSAAITVIVASWLGLPVSSTHIAVGAVFGVGFFREWDTAKRMRSANSFEVELPRLAKGRAQAQKISAQVTFYVHHRSLDHYRALCSSNIRHNFPRNIFCCWLSLTLSKGTVGAVRRMRTRIRLLAKAGSMRSIIAATQREQRRGSA